MLVHDYDLIRPEFPRIAHYDRDRKLIHEIAHDRGRFVEPVEVKKGESIALLITEHEPPCVLPTTSHSGSLGALR